MPGSRDRRWTGRRRLAAAGVIVALALALALAADLPWRAPQQREVIGAARIVDGDSLRIEGVAIRLKGIDAPEMAQTCQRAGAAYPCGREARRHLQTLVGAAPVRCRSEGLDRYRRRLAVCWAGERALNEAMVRDGWAVAYRDRAADALEREARSARRGLWAGEFERPADWRRVHAASAAGGEEPPDD